MKTEQEIIDEIEKIKLESFLEDDYREGWIDALEWVLEKAGE
jgi:hypothetical protein